GRGMHRWVWDLRYAAPLSVTHGYPISAVPHATPRGPEGPIALPGSYRIRLTVDGRKFEAPLTLRQDPRVPLAAGALEEQLRLATQLGALLTESSRALLAAQSQQAQLKALGTGGAAAQAVRDYATRLAAVAGPGKGEAEPAPPARLPDVQQHLATLYMEVTRADAAPTAAQLAATQASERALAPLLAEWQKLQADLPALNQGLRAAKLAPIRAQLPPPRDPNVADED
ncbi:MAG TPA: hypothetical protein VLX08_07700, partial [Steroidobacteraceae bacterium]|nr:hypothetical protein [Steroidobacteraceae bacterium]